MLILTRRLNETVMIGDDVAFTVLRISGNKVELGIHAPRSTPVHRREVYERLRRMEKRVERDGLGRA